MKKLTISLTPWTLHTGQVEMRTTVEIGAQTYEDRQIIDIPAVESLFDFCLRRAGENIKALWKQEHERISVANEIRHKGEDIMAVWPEMKRRISCRAMGHDACTMYHYSQ